MTSLDTTKRTALVTGGGRGIGRGIVEALLQENWNIAFCGMRAEEQISEVLRELRSIGPEVLYVQADVSQSDDRLKLIEAVKEQFGALHCLINNAGVAPKDRKDVLEATEDSYDYVMDINLRGPYFLTQLAANWMIEQSKADSTWTGSIININSISATVASPNRGEYCLSKAALAMGSLLWATRLGEFNIPVYEVRPGITKTDMTSGVTEKYDRLIEEGLLVQSRWGTPEDIGKSVGALARGDFPYSSGQVIMVDGGLTVPRL